MMDMTRRSEPPDPDKIIARMLDDLADAEAHLPALGGARVAVPWGRQIVQGIGGWGTVSGLVAAGATGFVIGLGALDATGVDAIWTLGYSDYDDAELGLDAFGWALEEG
jgi:hypothetical protein